MAGKLKEVRERMKSVQSTQQITKAMKMVSAAKLRKSQEAIQQLRPYSNQLRAMLLEVAAAVGKDLEIPLLVTPKEIKNVLIICITSDRGLCGAFNVNLAKLVEQHVKESYVNTSIQIWGIGKKGVEMLSKKGYTVDNAFQQIGNPPNITSIDECATKVMELFIQGKVDAVDVVYSEFRNAAIQIPKVEGFLPLSTPSVVAVQKTSSYESLFLFEQNPVTLLNYIIPLCLKTQLLKSILDNQASEHGARMSSMDKATENANEIFKQLKVSYNRARQAAITTELNEIIAGAAAL